MMPGKVERLLAELRAEERSLTLRLVEVRGGIKALTALADSAESDGPVADGLPQVLREYRERAGYTRASLARQAGIDPSYVARIEAGERAASRQVLDRLAGVLDLSQEESGRLLLAAGFAPLLAVVGGES